MFCCPNGVVGKIQAPIEHSPHIFHLLDCVRNQKLGLQPIMRQNTYIDIWVVAQVFDELPETFRVRIFMWMPEY